MASSTDGISGGRPRSYICTEPCYPKNEVLQGKLDWYGKFYDFTGPSNYQKGILALTFQHKGTLFKKELRFPIEQLVFNAENHTYRVHDGLRGIVDIMIDENYLPLEWYLSTKERFYPDGKTWRSPLIHTHNLGGGHGTV